MSNEEHFLIRNIWFCDSKKKKDIDLIIRCTKKFSMTAAAHAFALEIKTH